MSWFIDWFKTAYNWLNGLDGAVAAAVGGLILAAFVGIFKIVLIPIAKKIYRSLGRLLYPIASGAIFLDRNVALPRYLTNIQRVVGRLRNPWLIEGQELKDIFIPLSATTRVFGSERTELKQVFQSTEFSVLIGEPGSGKTTALKSIAMDCIHKRHAALGSFIPVFVELRQLMESGASLDCFVIETFQNNGFPRPQRLIQKLRKSGQLVFLLDALDEVDDKEKRKRVLDDIRDLITIEGQSTKPCRVFVTSRPTGYQGQLSDLAEKTLYMADFTPAQITKFINNWDFRPPKSQEKLINVVMDRRPILEICRNPLMLTIVTSLYRDTDYQLPDSREDFYKICIDALLRRWDAARELEGRNKFPPALKEAFLQGLAFEALSDWTKTFHVTWLQEKVEEFLTERKRDDIEPEVFLEEIIQSGLLGRLETMEIFFAHKTFAEALAASYLRNRPQDLIDRWRNDPDGWIEVCSLYVSDPLTSTDDIGVLIEDAKDRSDWSGLLTIAGEAHAVSEQQQEWIGTRLHSQKNLWATLNRRAVTALSRMKNEPQALLTAMVKEGNDTVRQEAIYSLGYSGKDWAVELIVQSLTEDELRDTAITSLAALGDSAVPILRDLISANSEKNDLLIACIGVAENIGSNAALEGILPLIWNNEDRVRFAATKVVLGALNDTLFRQRFEAGQITLSRVPSLSNELEQLKGWALPRVDTQSDLVKSYYCKMIDTITNHIRLYRDIYENIPTDLSISILINTPRNMLEKYLVNVKEKVSYYRLFNYSEMGNLVSEVLSRAPEKNKSLWARAQGKPLRDIELGEVGSIGFGVFSFITYMVPLTVAVWTDILSSWWLLSVIPTVIFTLWIAFDEGELRILLMAPAFISLVPGVFRQEGFNSPFADPVGLSGIGCFLTIIGIGIYAAVLLGGYWWLCFILSVIQCFFSEIDDIDHIIFWRRSNPLLALMDNQTGSNLRLR